MLNHELIKSFTVIHRLSLAVEVVDTADGRNIINDVTVSLVDDAEQPLIHRAGYALFLDRGSGLVDVQVDGHGTYQDTIETVDLGALSQTAPVFQVDLSLS